MDLQTKRPNWQTFLLVGFVLLIAVGGTLASLPVVPCPGTDHELGHDNRCPHCHGSIRITILRRWWMGPGYYPEWEGKVIASIKVVGAAKVDPSRVLKLSGLKVGRLMTRALENEAVNALYEEEGIEEAGIDVLEIPTDPRKVIVTIVVEEN